MGGDVRVEPNTWVGPNTLLDGSGGLIIGDGCDISAGVQIYTHDTAMRVLTEGRSEIDRAPVSIGNHCPLGAQSVVLRGVSIGDRTIVGAGSVVNRSLPAGTVAVGVPCRPIGRVKRSPDGKVSLIYDRRDER